MTVQGMESARTATPETNAATMRNTNVTLATIGPTIGRQAFQRANAGTVGHCEFEAHLTRRRVRVGAQ
jgi:hypothetical protein